MSRNENDEPKSADGWGSGLALGVMLGLMLGVLFASVIVACTARPEVPEGAKCYPPEVVVYVPNRWPEWQCMRPVFTP